MTKKGKKIPQERARMPSNKQLITISVILAVVIASASTLYLLFSRASEVPFSLNAGIIDQLAEEFPNLKFVDNITTVLKTSGFNVTYHNKTLTVDFFKGLAKYNYGIIILRVHSALREDNSTVDLFTSEEFSDYQYTAEIQSGLLDKGEFLYSPGKY